MSQLLGRGRLALILLAGGLFLGCSASGNDGEPDTGMPDTGSGDAGMMDTGPADTGGEDTGPGCTDTCPSEGDRACSEDGTTILDCADGDDDGCVEWVDLLECGSGTVCEGGTCSTPECTVEECSSPGAKQCNTDGELDTCGDFDGDGCLEWGAPTVCTGGQVCSAGACRDTCVDECSSLTARRCDALGRTETCDDRDMNGCLEWGDTTECTGGLVCAAGRCADTCVDECTTVGARQCDGDNGVQTCGNYDADSCLEWGTAVACASPLVCSAGACASTCSDECAAVGLRQCVPGVGTQYQTCGNFDSDACLEWGTATECGGTDVCSGGACAATCTNECTDGAKECTAGNSTRTCGNFDSDSCYEWGTPTPCAGFEVCGGGTCTATDPPETIILSEILVDSTGSPDTEAFIELHGPAGTSLSGYSVVAVNGNGGSVYATIDLSGTMPSDGIYVIAHPSAAAGTLAVADQTSASADLQNGPDSVQVRFGAMVVDALAYGTFGASEVAAGEGTPAVAPGLGQSLSRDASYTDTDDNASDWSVVATPTPGEGAASPNPAPVARLVCPAAAVLGTPVMLDASTSSDDGSIVNYAFSFGDASAGVSGTSATTSHTYASAGTYTASLTVTDDGGKSSTDTCDILITDGGGPSVVFIKPIDGKQVTQGETVQVLADANATGGRSITGVELFVDGVSVGVDNAAPYEWNYVVPAGAVTGSNIDLQLRATDNLGAIGISETRQLLVWNDVPQASFVAIVSGALSVSVDASSVTDTETPTANLEVRWDFESDGTWDTPFSTTKTASHTYPSESTYTITMQVRDGIGQTASTTRSVTLSLIINASGTINSTNWAGTVVVTGDINVPAGETLTISPGTNILFVAFDQDMNGIGDYDMTINGTLVANGTAEEPITFTVYGMGPKAAKDWNQIRLNGSGHQLSYVVVEYANTGIVFNGSATVTELETRFNCIGAEFLSSANVTWTGGEVRENDIRGLQVGGGALNATDLDVHDNAEEGIRVTNGTINLSDSLLRDNGAVGIEYYGGGAGLFTHNDVTGNQLEGIRITAGSSTDPNPVVNYNNIQGNALWGARVVEDVGLSASSTISGGTVTSGQWNTPGGESIDLVYYIYNEPTTTSSVTGEIRATSSGTLLASFSSTTSGWQAVSTSSSSLVARVVDGTSSYSGSLSLPRAAFDQMGATREVSVVTRANTIDMKHNYYGRFPDVLSVISFGDRTGTRTDANIHGFMGVAFDGTWTKGPYYGGQTLSSDTTWSGDIYVTGDVTVASGATLTILEGARIRFAPIDQDANGTGDYDIEVAGGLVVDGASTSPVTFTTYGTSKAPGDWGRINLSGASSSSNIQHTTIEYGSTPLRVSTGAHVVSNTTVQYGDVYGVEITSATNVDFTDVTVQRSVRGVRVASSSGVTLDGLLSTMNDQYGLRYESSTTAQVLTNSTISANAGNGVELLRSTVAISQNLVTGNEVGVLYEEDSAGPMRATNVKFNRREGVFLLSGNARSPNPTINGCNIYGNSVDESGVFTDPGLTASSTISGGTVTSAPWSTPGAQAIEWLRFSYSEPTTTSSVTGEIRRDSASGTVLLSASSSLSQRFMTVTTANVSTVIARVVDGTSSYAGSLSITGAFYYDPAANKEIVALTDSGTVNAQMNYWGTFPDVLSRMTLARTSAIDVTGYQALEVTGAGPL